MTHHKVDIKTVSKQRVIQGIEVIQSKTNSITSSKGLS